MRQLWPLAAVAGCAVALSACAFFQGPEAANNAPAGLTDLPARYQGKLPCADCSGIQYELSLYPDHVYGLERRYLGTPQRYAQHFELGRWRVDAAQRLVLAPAGDSRPAQWQIDGADQLQALDGDGQPIDSQLDYSLERTGAPVATPLENTYWKLVRLRGEAVQTQGKQREPHLVLHAEQSRVAGATGCNLLTGEYSADDTALDLTRLGSTRMACPGPAMQTEQAFSAALAEVRSYRVLADHLLLFDDQQARVAVFRATPLQ